MPSVYKTKGTKAYCSYCSEHLFTLSRDIYFGEAIQTNQIRPQQNQEIKVGHRSTCKQCGIEFGATYGIDWEDAL